MKRKSDFSQEELKQVNEAIRARMMVYSFHHLGQIDLRTGTVLGSLGLLEDAEAPEALTGGLLAIISDTEHEDRVDAPPGPLVFYKDTEKKIRSAIPMDFLLLNPDPQVRRVAITHFERLKGLPDPVLNPRSELVLTQSSLDIDSTNSQIWTQSALSVFDAVTDDFLVNLAGFKQSNRLNYQAGINTYLGPLLRPSISSIETINLPVAVPSTQMKELSTTIESIIESSPDLAVTLDAFLGVLGHLPLHPSCGLSKIIERKRGSLSPNELWRLVFTWAEAKESPLALAHACLFYLSDPSLIPIEEVPGFWETFTALMGISQEDGTESRWDWSWRVRCDLARHYSYFLECQLPGTESERVANLAWWLAERVSAAFGSKYLETVHNKVVLAELPLSTHAWDLVRPPLLPSLLQYASLDVPSAWTLSLLCQSAAFPAELLDQEAAKAAFKFIKDPLCVTLLGSFPPPTGSNEPGVYAFENGLLESGKSWFVATEAEDALKPILEMYEGCAEEGAIRERLDALKVHDDVSQIYITEYLKVLAFAKRLPEEVAWKYVSDPEWFNPVVHRLTPKALELFTEALIQLQIQSRGRWTCALPHFFAIASLPDSLELERRRLLFAFTVVCSIATETTSALTRLLVSDRRIELQTEISPWVERLEGTANYGLPWLQSRIRPVLTVLDRWNTASVAEVDPSLQDDKPEEEAPSS